MVATLTKHPQTYTLGLFKLVIDRLPPTFYAEEKKRFSERYNAFLNDEAVSIEDIQMAIANLGKLSWSYRKAYEDVYNRFGRSSEESNLLEKLDRGIREKYTRFIDEGGKLNQIETAKSTADLMNGSHFEKYFSPEEKYAIGAALIEARQAARQEIDELVTQTKVDEYTNLVSQFARQSERIEVLIERLRELAEVNLKWRPEIIDQVRTIEEGWSVVERGFGEDELQKLVEYWEGTMESFLH